MDIRTLVSRRGAACLLACVSFILGPRLRAGSEDVFSHLDLSRPELAAVKQAVDAGNTQAACAALIAHLRTRKTPKWYTDSPPAPKENPAATDPGAEKILRREYVFVGKPATLTKDLDWNANPLRDNEWPIELNRHYTWRTLVRAYNKTGNPAYARDFVAQLQDWCADNPRPKSSRQGRFTWRTLECGIRLSGSWPLCFFDMLNSPYFTPDVACLMLDTIWQQADYLTKFHGGGNWLVTETSGLMTAAVLFPEFKDAPTWRKICFDRLAREIDNQVPPDGAQVELTPHYHAVTLRSFASATRIAEFNGVPVPENVSAGIHRMVGYLMNVCKPDLYIPMFNDSDHGNMAGTLRPFATAEWPEMQYVVSHGKEGKAPAYTSIALPYSGQYVMRSGWDENALYLAMDAGPYGAGHQHEDKLQLEVHAFGRSHILDPGRFTYAGGPWRSYFVGTASHSTMLVNGHGQNRRHASRGRWVGRHAQDNLWVTNDTFDFTTGIYDEGYGGGPRDVAHIRKVFFKRGEYWLVHDLLVGPKDSAEEYRASVQYQFGATGATTEVDGTAIVSHNDDANLAILPVSDRPFQISLHEGEEKPPRGWIAWSLHKALKTPATMAVIDQKTTLPLRIDTLLLPYPGKARPDIRVRRLPEDSPEQSALEIVGPDWRDVYHCSHAKGTGPSIQWIRYGKDGKEQARASYGDAVTDAAELPVDALRGRLTVAAPAAGQLSLDYGLPEGGGYIFHREQEVAAGDTTLPLPSLLPNQAYVYAVTLRATGGKAYAAQGSHVPKLPSARDFEDGDLGNWGNAKIVKDGTETFLRTVRKADTKALYATIRHPLPNRKGGIAPVSLRFRTPLKDAGDWCYCKVSLLDAKGRRWSAYLSRSSTPSWKKVTLERGAFRRDDGNKGNARLPDDAILKEISVTLRKGVTKEPVEAILDIDDISWAGMR
jgi:hypothetical protein